MQTLLLSLLLCMHIQVFLQGLFIIASEDWEERILSLLFWVFSSFYILVYFCASNSLQNSLPYHRLVLKFAWFFKFHTPSSKILLNLIIELISAISSSETGKFSSKIFGSKLHPCTNSVEHFCWSQYQFIRRDQLWKVPKTQLAYEHVMHFNQFQRHKDTNHKDDGLTVHTFHI